MQINGAGYLPPISTNYRETNIQPDAIDAPDAMSSTPRPCRDYFGVECVKSVECSWGLFLLTTALF
jgi:hypothetical protein